MWDRTDGPACSQALHKIWRMVHARPRSGDAGHVRPDGRRPTGPRPLSSGNRLLSAEPLVDGDRGLALVEVDAVTEHVTGGGGVRDQRIPAGPGSEQGHPRGTAGRPRGADGHSEREERCVGIAERAEGRVGLRRGHPRAAHHARGRHGDGPAPGPVRPGPPDRPGGHDRQGVVLVGGVGAVDAIDNRGITASDRGTSMGTNAEPPAAAEVDPSETLGGRLRQARLQANLSLREVARQLGVSASFVSQLENGKSQPSVATLYSLARLLGASIDRLFDEQDHPALPTGTSPVTPQAGEHARPPAPVADTTPEEAGPLHRGKPGFPAVTWGEQPAEPPRFSVTTPGQRSRLVLESGVSWEQLVRKSDELDFIVLTYPAGSSSTTDGRMLRHDDYEYGYLLEGELEVTVGFEVFTLRAREAIGFDSATPHLFRNLGSVPARGIWVVHRRQT